MVRVKEKSLYKIVTQNLAHSRCSLNSSSLSFLSPSKSSQNRRGAGSSSATPAPSATRALLWPACYRVCVLSGKGGPCRHPLEAQEKQRVLGGKLHVRLSLSPAASGLKKGGACQDQRFSTGVTQEFQHECLCPPRATPWGDLPAWGAGPLPSSSQAVFHPDPYS